MVNSSIVSAFVDAVIGKISGLINSHNTSNFPNNPHQDK